MTLVLEYIITNTQLPRDFCILLDSVRVNEFHSQRENNGKNSRR